MSWIKRVFVDNDTVIDAEFLNGIQDQIINDEQIYEPLEGIQAISNAGKLIEIGQNGRICVSNNTTGITSNIREALLDIFQHVAYKDGDGQEYYDALRDALQPTELLSIDAVFNQGANVIYVTDSLDSLRQFLTVYANYSDGTRATTTVYTLSGILSVGTSTITVAAGGKTTTFTATVSDAPIVLQSISSVFNQGSTIVYDTDTLDSLKTNLVVTATYSDSSTAVVPSTDYSLSGTLAVGTSVITVTYQGKTDTFSVTVTHQAGTYSVSNNLTGCTNSNSSSTIAEGSSYSATITASSGYTMTGATVNITMGGTDITSTAYSNDTISIASVTGNIVITISAVAITLSSITAVYTQSGTVYDTDTLDSLKTDLVVTAIYSDSSTATVPSTDYTLSGTLTAGTSTVTVTYQNKTDTFNVTVTQSSILYDWDLKSSLVDSVNGATAITTATRDSNGVTFTEANTYLDFGTIYSRNRTYEIDIEYIGASQSSKYRRAFAYSETNLDPTSNTATLIVAMSTYRPGWYWYLGTAWDSSAIGSAVSTADSYGYFDGKTMKIYIDESGYGHVYAKTIGADDSTYVYVGVSHSPLTNYSTSNAHVYIGGSNNDMIAPARISGFRVYQGEV